MGPHRSQAAIVRTWLPEADLGGSSGLSACPIPVAPCIPTSDLGSLSTDSGCLEPSVARSHPTAPWSAAKAALEPSERPGVRRQNSRRFREKRHRTVSGDAARQNAPAGLDLPGPENHSK